MLRYGLVLFQGAFRISRTVSYQRSFQILSGLCMAPEDASRSAEADATPLSKNQQKKLKREQQWEANRAARKAKRKEKVREKKLQNRAAPKESHTSILTEANSLPNACALSEKATADFSRSRRHQHVQLPITFILDCSFDNLMTDKERKSLGSQITRCYSDNHKAAYQAHFAISSFGGHLKERFEGVLSGHHQSWKNVRFFEDDFVDTAEKAKSWMKDSQGGQFAGAFEGLGTFQPSVNDGGPEGEVIYLSSDSPNTLKELRPYSTYIIGALVDRNRHKGICYKKAMDRGVKTAKLPIGDYIRMTSRFVLATNHVAEIMLRWLEVRDWGKAFLQVIPKRKGGTLKDPQTQMEDRAKNLDKSSYNGSEISPATHNGVNVMEDNPRPNEDDGEEQEYDGGSAVLLKQPPSGEEDLSLVYGTNGQQGISQDE